MDRVGVLALALATRKNVLADSSLAGSLIVLAVSNTPNGIRRRRAARTRVRRKTSNPTLTSHIHPLSRILIISLL
jgi:hypothetical protein